MLPPRAGPPRWVSQCLPLPCPCGSSGDGSSAASLHSIAVLRSAARSGASPAVTVRPSRTTRPLGSYPVPDTVASPAGVHSRSAAIRPSVNVPVLSVAITVTEPSVSTAGSGARSRAGPPSAAPQCERERDHGGQRLRDGGDRQADRGHDHQLHRLSAYQAQGQDQRAQRHDHGRQYAAELGQPPLQRRGAGRGPHQPRDTAQRAVGPRGRDDGPAPPVDDDRARRHPAPRRIAVGIPARRLLHRHGLARQRGLVRQQGRRGHDVAVRGHDVALGQQDDVTGHHLGRRKGAFRAVAYDSRGRCAQGRQGAYGLFRPDLLHDAHRGVDHDDEEDHGGVGEVAGGDREDRGHQQHEDQRVAQLLQHPPPHGRARLLRERVRAVACQQARGLGGRQPFCRRRARRRPVVRRGRPLAHAPHVVRRAGLTSVRRSGSPPARPRSPR